MTDTKTKIKFLLWSDKIKTDCLRLITYQKIPLPSDRDYCVWKNICKTGSFQTFDIWASNLYISRI